MFSQKAFVHWYLKENMEENDFIEAREDLKYLELAYFDILSDQLTHDEDDDENKDNDDDY